MTSSCVTPHMSTVPWPVASFTLSLVLHPTSAPPGSRDDRAYSQPYTLPFLSYVLRCSYTPLPAPHDHAAGIFVSLTSRTSVLYLLLHRTVQKKFCIVPEPNLDLATACWSA